MSAPTLGELLVLEFCAWASLRIGAVGRLSLGSRMAPSGIWRRSLGSASALTGRPLIALNAVWWIFLGAMAGVASASEAPLQLFTERWQDGSIRDVIVPEHWQLVMFYAPPEDGGLEEQGISSVVQEVVGKGLMVSTVTVLPGEQPSAKPWWIWDIGLPKDRAFVLPLEALPDRVDPRFEVKPEQLPTAFLLDPDQRIRWRREGILVAEDVLALLEREDLFPTGFLVKEPAATESSLAASLPLISEMAGLVSGASAGGRSAAVGRCSGPGDRSPLAIAMCSAALGRAALDHGDTLEAREHLQRALESYESVDDPFGRWAVMLLAARVLRGEEDRAAAIVFLKRALEEVHTMQRRPEGLSAESLRWFLLGQGVPSVFVDAVLGFMMAGLQPIAAEVAAAATYLLAGSLYRQGGALEVAREALERALESSGKAFGLFDGAVFLEMGRVEQADGDLEVARKRWLEALNSLPSGTEAPFRDARVQTLGGLRDLEINRGHLEIALEYSREALSESMRSRGTVAVNSVSMNHALLLVRLTRLDEAKAFLDLVETGLGIEQSDNPCWEVVLPVLQSLIGSAEGDFQEASRSLELGVSAAGRCDSIDFRGLFSFLRNGLCFILGDETCPNSGELVQHQEGTDHQEVFIPKDLLWWPKSAEDVLSPDGQKALKAFCTLARETGQDSEKGAHAVIRAFGEIVDDTDLWARVCGIATDQNSPPDVSEHYLLVEIGAAYSQLASASNALKRDSVQEAIPKLQEAVRSFERAGVKDNAALLRGALGFLIWKEGNRATGKELVMEAVERLEHLAEKISIEDFLIPFMGSDRQKVYSTLVAMLAASSEPEKAFLYSERARARALLLRLDDPSGSSAGDPTDLESPGATFSSKIRATQRELARLQAQLSMATSVDARQQLEDQLAGLRAELDALVLRDRILTAPDVESPTLDPDLSELRRRLPDTDVVVSFFFAQGHLLTWVIDRHELVQLSQPWTRDEDSLVSCLASQLAHVSVRGTEVDAGCVTREAASTALWDKLVKPLQPYLRHRNVVVVPHGVLHHLPFAALRNGEGGRFWIQDVAISYAPSVAAWLQLPADQAIGDRVLVLGGSADSSHPLPWAEDEAEAVAQRLGVSAHVGLAAREGLVWQRAGQTDVLHLAAHGYLDTEDPRSSRVELQGDVQFDGRLEVRELMATSAFTNLDLVVLSACRTALGDRTRGDDIVGLVRGFMAAGAPTVVATLWPIDDHASAELMVGFYDQLLEGVTVGRALRQAQLEWIDSHRDCTEHGDDPYYWAGFGVYGAAANRRPSP